MNGRMKAEGGRMNRLIASLALTLGVLLGLGALIGLQGRAAAAPRQAANPRDVVINEVAWAGTAASTADEWIELYNNTDADINLAGWTLAAQDGSPNIALSGMIPARGYFLLERTDNNTVSDIPADWIGSFGTGLSNTGEALELRDSTNALVDSANGDGGAWPAGSTTGYRTMERINPAAADSDSNWASNDGVTRNGLDANSNPINGTPKARNSATPIPAANLVIQKTGPSSILAGQEITYTIAFSNVGNLDAAGVLITDVLPAFVTYTRHTAGYAFSQPVSGTLVWTVGPVGVASGTVSFQVGGQVHSDATGELTNAVTVTTSTTETVTINNHDTCTATVGTAAGARVLISAVLYDGYQTNDTDEAVQLINVGTAPANLTGWELCKDTGSGLSCRTLPSVALSPNARIWLARSAISFTISFGFSPDYALSSWLSSGLANGGDEVVLRDSSHITQDALVYKGGTSVAGWTGPAVQPYSVGREEGQILYRIPDETTGHPITDTNTAADWIQYTENYTDARRVLYPGWDLDPFFWPLSTTEQATITVGIAPDNAFQAITQTISWAQHSISVEVYSLRHPEVITALVQKARAGVSVDVLLEGGQVGVSVASPLWQQELWACKEIEAAGGRCWFMIHETNDRIFNRYDYLHAKFLIVDDQWVLITSQNFTSSSMPSDDKSNGTYGSRGVVLVTNAPSAVARAAQVFARDRDPAHHNDILRWNTAYTAQYGPPSPTFTPVLTATDYTSYTVRFPAPLTAHGSFDFELFTAPEAALRHSDALLGLLNKAGAGDAVYVQQMYEQPNWGTSPITYPNLRLEAYIAAARRGAKVRILLNSGSFEAEYVDTSDNEATVAYVNGLAQAERLDLQAAMGDPTQYGIHNKMVLVQVGGQGYAHIGSLNGSESSSKVNREMAIQIRSDAVYNYLRAMFDSDWWISHPIYLPLVLRSYTPPPPPVDYLVISEVYYAGAVSTEWVEIYNPTQQTIDLSQYKIGDAERTDKYEAMYRFPDGTTIAPQGVLVVAYDGSQVPQANFEIFNGSAKPDMIKYPSWGTGDWTLRNDGDQVLLLGLADQVVDVVVWGDATYPGVIPHPGVGTYFTHSLERYPAYYDTNNCAVDFRDLYPPDPGHVRNLP